MVYFGFLTCSYFHNTSLRILNEYIRPTGVSRKPNHGTSSDSERERWKMRKAQCVYGETVAKDTLKGSPVPRCHSILHIPLIFLSFSLKFHQYHATTMCWKIWIHTTQRQNIHSNGYISFNLGTERKIFPFCFWTRAWWMEKRKIYMKYTL